jgi:hypothetical protein
VHFDEKIMLDKIQKMWYNWPALHKRSGPEIPLYHSPSNLSIGKIDKYLGLFFPVFVQHYLLTFGMVCGILMVSRGEGTNPPPMRVGERVNDQPSKARKKM